jgi:hypothetical protein
MNVGVYEKLTAFNRCMEDVVLILKAYETMQEFDKGSMELFTREAEQLRASVNRYVGERMVNEADKEAVRLDALRPPEEREED